MNVKVYSHWVTGNAIAKIFLWFLVQLLFRTHLITREPLGSSSCSMWISPYKLLAKLLCDQTAYLLWKYLEVLIHTVERNCENGIAYKWVLNYSNCSFVQIVRKCQIRFACKFSQCKGTLKYKVSHRQIVKALKYHKLSALQWLPSLNDTSEDTSQRPVIMDPEMRIFVAGTLAVMGFKYTF